MAENYLHLNLNSSPAIQISRLFFAVRVACAERVASGAGTPASEEAAYSNLSYGDIVTAGSSVPGIFRAGRQTHFRRSAICPTEFRKIRECGKRTIEDRCLTETLAPESSMSEESRPECSHRVDSFRELGVPRAELRPAPPEWREELPAYPAPADSDSR